MKRLLDQLMARQTRLMTELTIEPQARAAVELSATARERLRAEEEQAIERASTSLGAGNLSDARAALEPHVETAQDVRTLTTLSRIHSILGDFDTASTLLVRAERMDATNLQVVEFSAELLELQGRHQEAIQFRRRFAYAGTESSATACAKLINTLAHANRRARKPLVSEIQFALQRFDAAPDRNAQSLMAVAQSIFGIDQLADRGRAYYGLADPCPATAVDIEMRWTTLVEWSLASKSPLNTIEGAGQAGRRPVLAELSDVVIDPRLQWTPFVDNSSAAISRLAPRQIRTRREDEQSPLLLSSQTRALVRMSKDIRTIERPVLVVGGTGVYPDDLLSYMGALAIVETLGCTKDLPLLVNDDLAAHQVEMLSLLGYDESRWLRTPRSEPVRLAHALVPSRLLTGSWVDPLLVSWYRRRLTPAASIERAHRRLCVLPSSEGSRRIANAEPLVAALAALEFEILDPARCTLREQIEAFSTARQVVLPTGECLASLIFAPAGASVTVLHDGWWVRAAQDRPFRSLVEACGQTLTTLECQAASVHPGQRLAESDLVVDIESLYGSLREHVR